MPAAELTNDAIRSTLRDRASAAPAWQDTPAEPQARFHAELIPGTRDWQVTDTRTGERASAWAHTLYGFEAREQAEIDATIRNRADAA